MTRPTLLPQPMASAAAGIPLLDIVMPVHNEETALEPSVRRLHAYLHGDTPFLFRARITVADNASTDATLLIAHRLEAELSDVRVVHLAEKGRGQALRSVWLDSDAAVLVYMDIDLSTDLAALLPLVAPLISGHSHLAIGSRLTRSSRVVRGPRREVLSRGYNLVLHGTLSTRFSDAQCGFKAIRADVAATLLPLVQDTGWFFDTELLVLAERSGLRIHEVPVDWIDDADSRVDLLATAVADLRGIVRVVGALATGALPIDTIRASLGRAPLRAAAEVTAGVPAGLVRQLVRFAGVGVACTAAYAVLYLLTQPSLGAQLANLLALLITAVLNTAANRRITFGVRGRRGAGRHQVQGLIVFAIGLGLTSGSLAVLHAVSGAPDKHLELMVLVIANLLATLLRFLALRSWVFRRRLPDPAPTTMETRR
ncbi:MAG: glycosyltransferase [Mycobacteriaceae bacterium]